MAAAVRAEDEQRRVSSGSHQRRSGARVLPARPDRFGLRMASEQEQGADAAPYERTLPCRVPAHAAGGAPDRSDNLTSQGQRSGKRARVRMLAEPGFVSSRAALHCTDGAVRQRSRAKLRGSSEARPASASDLMDRPRHGGIGRVRATLLSGGSHAGCGGAARQCVAARWRGPREFGVPAPNCEACGR